MAKCPHYSPAGCKGTDDTPLLEQIAALSDEIETVKAEYAEFVKQHEKEVGAAEAKLAGGEAVKVKPLEWRDRSNPVHGAVSVIPIDVPNAYYVNPFNGGWRIHFHTKETFPTMDEAKLAAKADYETRILSALTHPAPTHEDGSGEAADPEECERTAAFWGAEATKAMLQGDGDEAKRCLARSRRHALNAVRIRAIASGGKP